MTTFSTRAATIVAVLVIATSASGCTQASSDDDPPATTAAPETASDQPRSLVAPDTDTFDVDGGGTATLACEGAGPMPVVLVDGPDDTVDQWNTVIHDLGQSVLACRFVLPSHAGDPPATPTSQADALSQTLDASGLPGPYLLVAHSTGGLTVRRFGQRHRDQVGAAVFLDATDPGTLAAIHSELTATGWDAEATQADAEAPASWPDVPVTVFARDPGGEPTTIPAGTGPSGTDAQQAYATLTRDARVELVEAAGDEIDLGATRRVTNEIIRLVEQAT